MRFDQPTTIFIRPPRHRRRSGAILIWCAFLLPVLVAMLGLVIDGGLMMATYREGQNAADAAALAAAMDLMIGRQASAQATGQAFVTDAAHNNLPDATVSVNIPPSQGPYAGLPHYAEAVVTVPITTHFIQVIPGFNRNRNVTARAIAGFEPIAIDEGVMSLNHTGTTLTTTGNAQLKVNGSIIVNSISSNAVKIGKYPILATDAELASHNGDPSDFRNYDPSNPTNPLHTDAMPSLDRFAGLPTPTLANGVNPAQNPSHPNGAYQPGVYTQDIKITGDATFSPGIYVMKGASLSIEGNGTVTGYGVMFYFTGSNYTTAGTPDSSDPIDPLNLSPPTNSGTSFGTVDIAGTGRVTLTPLADANSPFDGMLFYYRRANTSEMSITGNSDQNQLTGTIYDKYGSLKLAGQGVYDAQFVVGSVTMSGNGDITINNTGQNTGKAPQVFLVE